RVREVGGLGGGTLFRPPQPRLGFVQGPLVHQVAADVVVGVAEGGVRRDRLTALFDRVVVPPRERVRPTAKRIRLGGRQELERTGEEPDRFLAVAREELRRSLLPE